MTYNIKQRGSTFLPDGNSFVYMCPCFVQKSRFLVKSMNPSPVAQARSTPKKKKGFSLLSSVENGREATGRRQTGHGLTAWRGDSRFVRAFVELRLRN
ncbi:Os01g0366501 [Oryza sativa Japonica Group]|uniref:Os01g0366501 protein n=1 Tax=Oryza sativa subsp. japonica TaxID=39947 RepID=A0A0P0V2H0_ORYSJ|nr:hypothetical protein EE612_002626 [Oryza sativa]BAS72140.1 Os01g0366501 [Oryza sativa Japonica Group]